MDIEEIPRSKEDLSQFISALPPTPGVYKFISKNKSPIYIGKAKNIKNRVSSYFQDSQNKPKKIKNLIREALFLEIILTNNELEALLLEQHFIKEHKPKFNVQFRDDKGYPWIKIELSNDFPSAKSFLGKKEEKERYFGPFPSSYAVRDALSLVQKIFKLRNCSDNFFKNRTRPCIQYQIGRCSAPCVGYINKKDYLKEVKATEMLLKGKSEELISDFYSLMDYHSKNYFYERAASYRDKISALRDIQRTQSISGFLKERDAVVCISINGSIKIGITSVSGGWITGHKNFTQSKESDSQSTLESFLLSHYLSSDCPAVLVLDQKILHKNLVEMALSKHHCKLVKIISKPGKKDKGLIDIAKVNTNLSMKKLFRKNDFISISLKALSKSLGLNQNIEAIESFDISHYSGKNAVGGCVVYGPQGKIKKNYRLYNISNKKSGNDIAAMKEVIKRRYKKVAPPDLPNLIIIDGGLTHLKAMKNSLDELSIGNIEIIGISKGARRKSEFDKIHRLDGSVIKIIRGSSEHLLIQEIRDETHRFSIANQRKKQIKSTLSSEMDQIHGIGKKKKESLLRYFGSLEQIKRASYQDLQLVSGIGKKISLNLHKNLH